MLSTILFATVMTVVSHHPTYVLSSGQHMASCNGADTEDIDTLRDRYGDRFFWYRDDGRSYVVRDAAALDAIEELFRPQREVGREQSALGRKQSDLGRQQSALGRRQSELGREQSSLAWDPDRRERMRELGDQMRDLGDQMRGLGDKMRDLGDQMRVKGDEMRALGRDIDRKLHTMMRDFATRGVAREVD